MTRRSRWLLRSAGLLLILLSALAVVWSMMSQRPNPPPQLVGVLRSEAVSLRPFELLDHNEKPANVQMFRGKWSFVFFGYTSCPDICPVTLQVLNAVTESLKKNDSELLRDTQVVFVSVDPERDTATSLADYVAFFNKDFIGLSGDTKNIDNFTQQFGAGYMRGQETSPGEYLVAHSSAVFLVAPDAAVVAAFSQPHNPETIASQYKGVRAYLSP